MANMNRHKYEQFNIKYFCFRFQWESEQTGRLLLYKQINDDSYRDFALEN